MKQNEQSKFKRSYVKKKTYFLLLFLVPGLAQLARVYSNRLIIMGKEGEDDEDCKMTNLIFSKNYQMHLVTSYSCHAKRFHQTIYLVHSTIKCSSFLSSSDVTFSCFFVRYYVQGKRIIYFCMQCYQNGFNDV